jgi:hypothetical protein
MSLRKRATLRNDMNDICDDWSLRWHELQRNLAGGFNAPRVIHHGAASDAAKREILNMKGGASASWLVRARQRAEPPAFL